MSFDLPELYHVHWWCHKHLLDKVSHLEHCQLGGIVAGVVSLSDKSDRDLAVRINDYPESEQVAVREEMFQRP